MEGPAEKRKNWGLFLGGGREKKKKKTFFLRWGLKLLTFFLSRLFSSCHGLAPAHFFSFSFLLSGVWLGGFFLEKGKEFGARGQPLGEQGKGGFFFFFFEKKQSRNNVKGKTEGNVFAIQPPSFRGGPRLFRGEVLKKKTKKKKFVPRAGGL